MSVHNLIMWGSMIWLPWLMYFMLVNECKPKKNIVVGVTVPYSGQNDPRLLELLVKFKKEMRLACLFLTVIAIPGLFLPGFGLSMTVWMIWVVLVCILPMVPYVRCNTALKALKEQRGWAGQSRPAGELKAAAELKWLSPVWFVVPVALSLVPLALDRELWLLWAVMAVLVVFFYICYRCCFRSRSEMVDGCTERTLALTRIRRYNWGKAWLLLAWATGIFTLLMWLTMDYLWWQMGVILVYAVVVMVAVLGIELRVRRLQEKLSVDSGQDFYVDEDDKWLWGIFYYDPGDSRLMVNARVGMNSSVNLARPAGKVLMGAVALLLAAMPLVGLWLMGMEKAPVELELTERELVSTHYTTEYRLEREDIASVELVEELPVMTRAAGTAMPSARSGKWNSREWGRFTCCIDPRQGPWLLVETEEGMLYLFGGNAVERVYDELT